MSLSHEDETIEITIAYILSFLIALTGSRFYLKPHIIGSKHRISDIAPEEVEVIGVDNGLFFSRAYISEQNGDIILHHTMRSVYRRIETDDNQEISFDAKFGLRYVCEGGRIWRN